MIDSANVAMLYGGVRMTVAVKEILRQAEPLSADEQLTLAAMLIEQARKKKRRVG